MPMYYKRRNLTPEEWELLHLYKRNKRDHRIIKRKMRTSSKTISFLAKEGDEIKIKRHKIDKQNMFKKRK